MSFAADDGPRYCAWHECGRKIDDGLGPGNSGGGAAWWAWGARGTALGPYCCAYHRDLAVDAEQHEADEVQP